MKGPWLVICCKGLHCRLKVWYHSAYIAAVFLLRYEKAHGSGANQDLGKDGCIFFSNYISFNWFLVRLLGGNPNCFLKHRLK